MPFKQLIMDLITEEKNKYNLYVQLCTSYNVDADKLIVCKHTSKIEILETLLKLSNKDIK